jgi:hypothetical protein
MYLIIKQICKKKPCNLTKVPLRDTQGKIET